LDRDGAAVHGTGHARVMVGKLAVTADEATFHHDTGMVELKGHVSTTLPAREDDTLVRYGAGNLLTQETVVLTADRMSIHGGALRAAGNVVVAPNDPELPGARLSGDELSMNLATADGTIRGNIRAVKLRDDSAPSLTDRQLHTLFPPDIVK